ncbi:translation elongation factor Ts [bacterium]|nr:translation elongation factor Ts [bacterium]
MSITAQMVKDLREKTGAGMMECKKALNETGGDMEGAIEFLRKAGLQALSKKASRVAADGIVVTALSADKLEAVILELNCETDFVAKNDDFVAFANQAASLALSQKPGSVDELLTLKGKAGSQLSEELNTLVAKIGEKISLRRFIVKKAGANETLGSYIHMGAKIGVVVVLGGVKADDGIIRDVAMHAAAAFPQYLKRDEIPAAVIDKEREIYKEQMKDSGKPAEMMDKILDGKIAKFAKDVCLVDQIFIKDPTGKKSVAQVLKEVNPALFVSSFTRFQVGEGIEKKEDNFADEVAKMAK